MVIISVSACDDHAVSSLHPQKKTNLLTFVYCQGNKLHIELTWEIKKAATTIGQCGEKLLDITHKEI